MKGSESDLSEEEGLEFSDGGCVTSNGELVGCRKGPEERRRIAWVIVGWKRPPNLE